MGVGFPSKADSPRPRPTDNQWARAVIDGRQGLHTGTSQAALTVVLTLLIGGLTSVILVVLKSAALRFLSWLVCIPLRPVLGIAAACVTAAASLIAQSAKNLPAI